MEKFVQLSSSSSKKSFRPRKHRKNLREFDRISELPDEVLCSIVSHLPFAEAARTSVLAHRWKPLWYSFHGALDIVASSKTNMFPMDSIRQPLYDFLTSITQTLPLLSSPSLDAFIVRVGNRYKFCTPHLDLCFQFAMRKKNIKCFEIDTDPRDSGLGFTAHYNLPAVFYVWIKSPDGLDSISSLTSVSLNQVNVSDDLIQHLLVNCPLLESLRVVDSRELLNPKFIGGPTLKLKYLEIFGIYLESVELCTPNLVSFTANNEKVKLHIKNAPKLVELSISVGVVNERPESVSSYLPHLERLTLDFSILNHTFKTQLMHQFDELNRLQHLTWKLGKYWHELTIKLNSMLEASPFLHKFTLVNSMRMVRTLHIVPNVTAKHPHRCLKLKVGARWLLEVQNANYTGCASKACGRTIFYMRILANNKLHFSLESDNKNHRWILNVQDVNHIYIVAINFTTLWFELEIEILQRPHSVDLEGKS